MSDDELQRASAFRIEAARKQFVAARTVVRALLADVLGVSPRTVTFGYGPFGKPYLCNVPTCLQFNVSHSAGELLVGITSGARIGVDVEQIRSDIPCEEIVTNYFSPREVTEFRAIDPKERISAFYSGWTRKEAVIKAVGLGVSYGLDNFDVTIHPSLPARLLRARGEEDMSSWTLRSVTYKSGFAAAYAVDSPDVEVRTWEFSRWQ